MDTEGSVRLDKWLWAARFFKTRSAAAKAVAGGKVHLNSARIKPARSVAIGDLLRIQRGETEFTVTVHGLSDRRGPASVARTLYEETGESLQARERQREERKLLNLPMVTLPGRPSKRNRRLIRSFIRKEE